MSYGQPPGYGPPGAPGGYGPPPGGGYGQPPGGYGQPPQGFGGPPMGGPPGYGAPMQPPPKKGMSGAAIILIILAVGAALFGGSCLLCICVGAKGASDQAAADNQARANAISVTADTLISDYKANEVRADGKWKGKYVLVSGVVTEVSKDFADSMIVNMGSGKPFELQTVMCHLGDKDKARAAALSKGNRVTVRGKVDGLLILAVQIHDCEIR